MNIAHFWKPLLINQVPLNDLTHPSHIHGGQLSLLTAPCLLMLSGGALEGKTKALTHRCRRSLNTTQLNAQRDIRQHSLLRHPRTHYCRSGWP